MASRTTEDKVRVVIDTDVADLDFFLASGNEFVSLHLASSGLSDVVLSIIETYIVAHLVAITDPRAASEGVGPLSTSFQSRVDLGLYVTHYGQQAILYDTSGTLSSLAQGAAGKTPKNNSTIIFKNVGRS
jgi:hypothetical protein